MFGIPASEATFIIGTVGLVGAFVFTPLMGILADRKAHAGANSPWILWTAIPFGVLSILAFTTPISRKIKNSVCLRNLYPAAINLRG